MIEYFTLLLAFPLGYLLATVTHDEKEIYSKNPYFPVLLWTLAFTAAILFTTSTQLALTTAFIFLMTLSWHKA